MLIAIDGNEANVQNRVGSNIYSYELLQAIYQCQKGDLRFKIYLKEKPLADLPKETDWWQYRIVGPKRFWTQFGLPLDLFFHRPRPDVFFTPGHYLPRWSPCPTVMSIMDLSYIYFPEMFRKRDLWQLRKWTAYSVKKAKAILTISEFSKNAIIDYYHLDKEKVVVTYPGVNKEPVNTETRRFMGKAEKIKKKYGVEGDYILYVGTLQPRKNLERLIEAFKLFSNGPNVNQINSRMKLVIVGKKGWLYQEIFKKVKELDLAKKVIFTGYVPDEDLPAFYRNAQCFVLVSLYEGFGLTALEAMHYGCPVVASNISSLPEVVGQAGILVDPENVEEIASGIEKAIKNRDELIKKGYQQAKKFSWKKCAKETLKVLEMVVKK